MDNLKGSFVRFSDKGHISDNFSIKIDPETKKTLKGVFIKLLSQLTNAVLFEQTFCQEFFSIKSNKSDEVSNSTIKNNSDSGSLVKPSLPRTMSTASVSSTGTSNSKINDSKNDL